MDKNTLSRDFLVKVLNLCNYLQSEKKDFLLSDKLFSTASSLGEYCYMLEHSSLSKNETTSFRKDASLFWDKTVFYLECVYISGLISEAQKESMLQTLTLLKKETNF